MKNIFYVIVLLICCITLVSCGNKKGKESSVPMQLPKKIKESSVSQNREINMIFGRWKILDMIGNGYIYGDVSMEDYVGGIVTIRENSIESDLPLGKRKLKNPKYKLSIQNEDDFWEYRHANIDNGFGFKNNLIKLVEVYDGNNDSWDEFGETFWVRDKKHLIFLGPVYFLAEKIE